MKEAVEAKISFGKTGRCIDVSEENWNKLMDGFETGDKVKLIIIKED